MPPLSAHFRLATLLLTPLGITSHAGSFLLGTTAPDAFEPESEESFARHHFKEMDGGISLQMFLQKTNLILQPTDDSSWSFHCGYYCHLWLDVFYRDHADRLPVKKPAGMSDTDLRNLLRRETEILNAPCVLEIGKLSIPRPEDLALPTGLEFVERERCVRLFHEVIKQSQAWSQLVPTLEAIHEADYTGFFGEASKLFTNEIRNASRQSPASPRKRSKQ